MPGDDDAADHKGQLPPFTPPKFHWGQDNLYEQYKSFKRVVEFTFKGQYEKCSNRIKCGSILNWLGIEAYPEYDILPLTTNNYWCRPPLKVRDNLHYDFIMVLNGKL